VFGGQPSPADRQNTGSRDSGGALCQEDHTPTRRGTTLAAPASPRWTRRSIDHTTAASATILVACLLSASGGIGAQPGLQAPL
jgi:hypothetical protein